MLWIACLAIILAGVQRNRFFPALFAMVAYFVLAMDLLRVAIEWWWGQSVFSAWFPNESRRIDANQPLWAVADGFPIRVELITPHQADRQEVEFGRVADRVIDGRMMVCDVADSAPQPLDLIDRGPILVDHERHGLCLVQPLHST
jgi:hypothetical protein